MNMRTRKAIGCTMLLAYMGLYSVLAASVGVALVPLIPTWAQLVFYALAGIVWIFPLKPLFAWMNRSA
jgi:membrane protein implicated in regulation of membrane protease activity